MSLPEELLAAGWFIQYQGDTRLINGREICSDILNIWKHCPTLNVPETQGLESERLFGERLYMFAINSCAFPRYLSIFGRCQG